MSQLRCIAFLTSFCGCLLVAPQLLAGESSYWCEVIEHQMLSNEGSLRRPPKPYLIGEMFRIDSVKGHVEGASLTTDQLHRSMVLDHGSERQSYKLLTFVPAREGGLMVSYINVEEFAPGPTKPFVAIRDSTVLSGTCR